jgi:hypothetical protein
MFKKAMILCLSSAQLLMPVLLVPEENMEEITRQAQMDAEEDVNALEWMTTGFLVMPLGVVSAKIYSPMPSSRISGMSSRHIKAYAKPYRSKVKEIQTKYAKRGCLIGAVFWPSIIFAAIQLGIFSKERFI